jgi:hypothetical protein
MHQHLSKAENEQILVKIKLDEFFKIFRTAESSNKKSEAKNNENTAVSTATAAAAAAAKSPKQAEMEVS